MPKGCRKHLTEDEREKIRELKQRKPGLKHRELAAMFGVSGPCICGVLNSKAKPKPAPKVRMLLPPITVQQPDSIIRPIPLSRLMAGR